jgi:hypothetical protein
MSDDLKERNILKLILIVRFACATLNVRHPIFMIFLFRTREKCAINFAIISDGCHTKTISHDQKVTTL